MRVVWFALAALLSVVLSTSTEQRGFVSRRELYESLSVPEQKLMEELIAQEEDIDTVLDVDTIRSSIRQRMESLTPEELQLLMVDKYPTYFGKNPGTDVKPLLELKQLRADMLKEDPSHPALKRLDSVVAQMADKKFSQSHPLIAFLRATYTDEQREQLTASVEVEVVDDFVLHTQADSWIDRISGRRPLPFGNHRSLSLAPESTKYLPALVSKVAEHFGVPESFVEPPHVLRFYPGVGTGGRYDDFHTSQSAHAEFFEGGPRMASAFVYLNDVADGEEEEHAFGDVVFPLLESTEPNNPNGLRISPAFGRAVFWKNYPGPISRPNAEQDDQVEQNPFSFHELESSTKELFGVQLFVRARSFKRTLPGYGNKDDL